MKKTGTYEQLKAGEKTFTWDDLNDNQQYVVAFIHAKGLNSAPMKLKRIFNQGKPKIIFGEDFKYCRVHPDSVDAIKLLTRGHL